MIHTILTSSDIATLKALVLADPTASVLAAEARDVELADWLNQATSYIVWRSVLTPAMARTAVVSGTSLGQLDNLTSGKREALLYAFDGDLDVSDVNVRTSLDDLCGTQTALKASIQAAEKRAASRAEKALATGTGTTATPGALAWEGVISYSDASLIRS